MKLVAILVVIDEVTYIYFSFNVYFASFARAKCGARTDQNSLGVPLSTWNGLGNAPQQKLKRMRNDAVVVDDDGRC